MKRIFDSYFSNSSFLKAQSSWNWSSVLWRWVQSWYCKPAWAQRTR